MLFSEYQEQARRTQRKDLPLWALREHALFLLGSEIGEVMGLHQKVHQGHPLDVNELKLEIGDVMWGLAELCDVYGFDMGDVAQANIEKLKVRYKERFTVKESVNRMEYRDKHVRQKSRYYAKGEGRRG
jgi:NTP pyrophosphatase (non-canonical NTP hydrolase)